MGRQAPGGGPAEAGAPGRHPENEGPEGAAQGDGANGRFTRLLGRADLKAVPETRRALRDLLLHWGGPGRSETAELLLSELVTNALLHTDRDAQLTAVLGPRGLRVEVRDDAERQPQLRVPVADDGTNGRGLFLVQSLADAWGVAAPGAGRSGKVVWFELDGGAA